ncbi:uncharacterized protein FIBRA_04901 [Fibroporia radiculosa]|uniref:DNA mismatch repair protein MutS core domain-containing protein n=1 Tax=Fibroporia radiculosa TaxID=599839 RepID=J4GQ09_9APHY|nr:uncharacterized protein FIBRA_04901 [Fibroporia radiculosa]CCM02790.1 predicted protein [Fibroporia radiculosa]
MVALLGAIRNASAYRCVTAFPTRGLKTSRPFCANANVYDAPKTARKRTITKKQYPDLPKACLQADGCAAEPLGEWRGGLEPKAVADDFTQVKNRENTATMHKSLEKRRARKRKSADQEGVATDKLPPEPEQPRNRLATEILDNLSKFPHCILLTRVGQFYESYFDQAKEVSRLLNIKLTQRTWDGQRIWMCGFPLMHLDKYLKILVQHQKRFIALCEEFPRLPQGGSKDGFDRRVVRVVTPGTLIDEPFLNAYENNYLLAIADSKMPVGESTGTHSAELGLAWIDVSTGEFFTKSISLDGLRDELVRIGPREVVIDEDSMSDELHPVRKIMTEEDCFASYFSHAHHLPPLALDLTAADGPGADDVTSHLTQYQGPAGTALTTLEVGAITLLTGFLRANLLDHMPQLSSPSRETTGGRMQIDAHTIKALEIREGINDGLSGSLLSAVKRTVTSSGTRLLSRWLCSPSTSLSEINARQSLVAFFHTRTYLREDIAQALADLEDATRIIQKFLLGRGQPSDLSAIRSAINTWNLVKNRIELEKTMEDRDHGCTKEVEWSSIDALINDMHDLGQLSRMLESSLPVSGGSNSTAPGEGMDPHDNNMPGIMPPFSPRSINTQPSFGETNWSIHPSFSEKLTTLHAKLVELMIRREQLERQLQFDYDAPSLTLRSSPGYGMHIHIARGKRDSAKLNASSLFVPISQNNSTNVYLHKDWSQLGAEIVDTTTAIYAAEREAFDTLRNEAISH